MAGKKRKNSCLLSEPLWITQDMSMTLDCKRFLENMSQNRRIKPTKKTPNLKQKNLRLIKKGTDCGTILAPAFYLNGVNGQNAQSVVMMGKMGVGLLPEPDIL